MLSRVALQLKMGKNVDKIYTEKFDFDPGVQFFMDFLCMELSNIFVVFKLL